MWVSVIFPPSMHPVKDDFNQFHDWSSPAPQEHLYLTYITTANSEKDKLLQAELSPYPEGLYFNPIFPNFWNLPSIYLEFSLSPAPHWPYPLLPVIAPDLWIKKEELLLPIFCVLLIGKESLKSTERIALWLSIFNNL